MDELTEVICEFTFKQAVEIIFEERETIPPLHFKMKQYDYQEANKIVGNYLNKIWQAKELSVRCWVSQNFGAGGIFYEESLIGGFDIYPAKLKSND